MTDSLQRRARGQREKSCIMHRARAAAAAALVAVLVAVVALASQRHATPLLLHELPQPQNSLITVAVAILPPSPTFSPQPFPLETGIHQPHTAPPMAGRSCGLLLRDAAGAGGL